jgi:hypothetical protein
VKFRPSVVLAAVLATAAFDLALIAPAQAAVPDPATAVTAPAQVQGAGLSWSVSAGWTASANADGYRVAITDQADGTNTPGSYYASKDVSGSATSATLETGNLVTGRTYWVAVRALNGPDVSAPAVHDFVAATLDTTGPSGTFKLDHTKDWVGTGMSFFRTLPSPFRFGAAADGSDPSEDTGVEFAISQTTLSDDTTPAAQIVRKVKADTSSPAAGWTSGRAVLTYAKAGTYHPQVILTDQYGNSSTVALPTITVLTDAYGPTVRITRPRPALRSRVAGWRVLRGTIRDGQSGPGFVMAMVLQKRGTVWYAYDFSQDDWVKGSHELEATLENVEAMPAFAIPHGSHWRMPRIHGLRAGVVHIESIGIDNAGNLGIGPTIQRKLTR